MIYRIDGFYPPEDFFPGCYGFSSRIDLDSAVKLRDFELKPETAERFQAFGRDITSNFKLNKFGVIEHPYRFCEDSLLLWGVDVPGNACDLSLDDSGIRNFLSDYPDYKNFVMDLRARGDNRISFTEYVPHNVDMPLQAHALLSLWLHWANSAEALMS